MVNGSQFAGFFLHRHSLSDSQICDYENVARRIKIISNTCNEKNIVNIQPIKSLQ